MCDKENQQPQPQPQPNQNQGQPQPQPQHNQGAQNEQYVPTVALPPEEQAAIAQATAVSMETAPGTQESCCTATSTAAPSQGIMPQGSKYMFMVGNNNGWIITTKTPITTPTFMAGRHKVWVAWKRSGVVQYVIASTTKPGSFCDSQEQTIDGLKIYLFEDCVTVIGIPKTNEAVILGLKESFARMKKNIPALDLSEPQEDGNRKCYMMAFYIPSSLGTSQPKEEIIQSSFEATTSFLQKLDMEVSNLAASNSSTIGVGQGQPATLDQSTEVGSMPVDALEHWG
jgi:hypothetical protein